MKAVVLVGEEEPGSGLFFSFGPPGEDIAVSQAKGFGYTNHELSFYEKTFVFCQIIT